MKRKVLIAEDDPNIAQGLLDLFEADGFEAMVVGDGEAGLEAYRTGNPDLVVLDIMMPRMSGYDVCRNIRKTDGKVPIIILTAKGEEIDKVVGLELGADDYVTKPFGVHELRARVAAVLRRAEAVGGGEDGKELPDVFCFGAAQVDRRRYSATLGGKSVGLTAKEMLLLEAFVRRPDEVLSRNELLNLAWGVDYLGTTRTLDQHIAQVRKKIEVNPASPKVIVTVHGVGYRYTGERSSAAGGTENKRDA